MRQLDPAWLDVQYNNRARVVEHAQILDRWSAASSFVRQRLKCELGLPYGDGPNETLDVFPALHPKAPVLVFIHGGWWRSLDKSDQSFIAPSLVSKGAMVVVPNYALCPAVTIRDIALQMVRAVVWVYRNAARYGGDPHHIVVAGHSAGGHLAALLLCCQWRRHMGDLPERLVRSALSISGLFDLEPIRRTPFLANDLKLTPPEVRALSPALLPAPADLPLYAFVGGNESEEFKRQNRLIREAWGLRQVPVCEELPGLNHFDVLHDLADADRPLHRAALALLGLC